MMVNFRQKLNNVPVLPLLLVLCAVLVFGRMLWQDFQLSWDDHHYILNNPVVHGLTWEHVSTAFMKPYFGNYAPLHLVSYMIDFELWQLQPGGYKLTNLLLHVCNSLLAYWLLIRLHGSRVMAFAAAALFLLHPLQVESVAWISQRKNLLSMLFFLLAWHCYIDYRRAEGGRRVMAYPGAVILFCCAVLSKSVAVVFPLVLMLFDLSYNLNGVKESRTWIRLLDKLPFCAIAALVGFMTVNSQAPVGDNWDLVGGGVTTYHGGSPLATFYSMLPVFCRYLAMIVWPSGLNVRYNPPIYTSPEVVVLLAGAVLAGVLWCIVRLYRMDRRLGFWGAFFWIGFIPVSQIVPLVTLINDRYAYLPMLGVSVLAGAGCAAMADRVAAGKRYAVYGGIAVLVALPGIVAYQRVEVWRDSISLWKDSVAKSPDQSLSWTFLAQAYERTGPGMLDQAIEAYRRALALEPSNAYALYGMSRAQYLVGRLDSAGRYIEMLLAGSPNHVMGLTQQGLIFEGRGMYEQAEQCYQRALSLQPESVEIGLQLARLALLRGDHASARWRLLQLEVRPVKHPEVAYLLAWFEAQGGDAERALDWLEKAMERGYAEEHQISELNEFVILRGNPRFERMMQRHGYRR